MSLRRHTYPNGLTVILAPTDGGHAIHVAAFIGMGSAYESPETSGMSHFVEHLLFQGSDRFPTSAELCAFVEERGGEVNAHTTPEFTSVYVTLHRDYAAEGVETLFALTFGVAQDRWDIERERSIILHEQASQLDPDAFVRELLWDGHPLAYDISGTRDTVSSFSADDLRRHFANHMRPSNVVIVVAGSFDADDVEQVIQATFGAVASGPGDLPASAAEPVPSGLPTRSVRPAFGGACEVLVALPVCGLDSPDVVPLVAANFLLGGGLSSRLFLHVRERDGLAYEIGTDFTTFRQCGYFLLHASCTPEHLHACIRGVLRELCVFGTEGVTESEMARLRRFVHCNADFRSDNPMELAAWYGVQELLVRPYALPTPASEAELVATLDRTELNATLRRWLRPEAAHVVCHTDGGWWQRRRVSKVVAEGLNWRQSIGE